MKTRLLAILCCLAWATSAQAQVAFDAASVGGLANATSLTWSHTTAGSDRFLVVTCRITGANDLTGVTYNSVSMTQIRGYVNIPGSSDEVVVFGLTAPATGANNVVVSRTGADNISCTSSSYTGVSQTGQPEATGENAAASVATLSVSATVVTSGAWLVLGCAAPFTGGAFSAGTGTTMRDESDATFFGINAVFDSNGAPGTGSQASIAACSCPPMAPTVVRQDGPPSTFCNIR